MSKYRHPIRHTVFVLLVVACAANLGCRSNKSGTGPHGTDSLDGAYDGGVIDGSVSDDGGTPDGSVTPPEPYPPGKCSPQDNRPEGIPPGWQRYDGYACGCPYYLPGPRGQQLPTVEWVECGAPIPVEGSGCLRIKSWEEQVDDLTVYSDEPEFWRDRQSSKSYLMLGLMFHSAPTRRYMIAELDGPVAFSLIQPNETKCPLAIHAINENKYAFALGDGLRGSTAEGVLAGDLRESYPSVAWRRDRGDGLIFSSYAVSSRWVLRGNPYLSVTAWDESQTLSIDGDSVPNALPRFWLAIGGDVFFHAGGANENGTLCWTQSTGTQLFLRWPGDTSRATGNFGTDGHDMVWTYIETKQNSAGELTKTFSAMTAPYTTSPETAQTGARRLRSDDGVSQFPYSVGCGYAARPDAQRSLRIVRLSDGVSWTVARAQEGYYFWRSLGFACKADGSEPEVVALVVGTQPEWRMSSNVVRIKISALGPGVQPD